MRDNKNDFDALESPGQMAAAEAAGPWQVYFLSLIDPADPGRDFGLVKIGITKNDVEIRIEHLQTGNPYQIRCEASFRSPVARQVEHWVHRTNASRVAQLEWLRLARSEIPDLVMTSKREGERLARIAEAMTRWSHSKSNGKERQPSAGEKRLHEAVRSVLADVCRVTLRLEHTERSIALEAGKVLRIPGIVKIWPFSPSIRFSSKTALGKFADLVAGHTVEEVGGRFYWRDVPHLGSPTWTDLRAEVECLKEKQRELDAAMLVNGNGLQKEGERTNALVRLHDEYLILKQQEARLKVDEEDIKAQMIQAVEDCEAVAGVCSFRRARRNILNGKSFCEAYPNEAAQCSSAREAHIRRRIYTSRSY